MCLIVQVPDSSTEDAEDSSSPVLCGHVIPGKFPSNLRQHLKSRHGAVYQKLLQSEEKQKEEREALKHKRVEEEEEEDEIVDENIDFEEKEFDHDITFKFYCKRVGCFAHTLQLVMQKFNQDQFKPLLKKVHSLVAKINRSSKATELLISLAQKKLVKDCPTRWSSTYLMHRCRNTCLLGGALPPKAAKTAQAVHLEGSGGMLPQESFENLVLRDATFIAQ